MNEPLGLLCLRGSLFLLNHGPDVSWKVILVLITRIIVILVLTQPRGKTFAPAFLTVGPGLSS